MVLNRGAPDDFWGWGFRMINNFFPIFNWINNIPVNFKLLKYFISTVERLGVKKVENPCFRLTQSCLFIRLVLSGSVLLDTIETTHFCWIKYNWSSTDRVSSLSMKWDGWEHSTPQHKGMFDMTGQGRDYAGELHIYTQQTLGWAAAAWSAFRIATGSSSACPCETVGQHEGARTSLHTIILHNKHLLFQKPAPDPNRAYKTSCE